MRPSPDELLDSLRLSLNETLLPKVEDRWARYVGTAMDLVLQHLKLRLAQEGGVLEEDSADMLASLAALGTRAVTLAERSTDNGGPRWEELAELISDAADPKTRGVHDPTARNEELRSAVITVMRWLDEAESTAPEVREMRDEVYQLVRRQVDRTKPMVEPLFMSFRPVTS